QRGTFHQDAADHRSGGRAQIGRRRVARRRRARLPPEIRLRQGARGGRRQADGEVREGGREAGGGECRGEGCVTDHENPLLESWTTPFEAPPFSEITPEHFRPAFDAAIAEHKAEIEAIAGSKNEPGFANTIAAMELAGARLDRVAAAFYN